LTDAPTKETDTFFITLDYDGGDPFDIPSILDFDKKNKKPKKDKEGEENKTVENKTEDNKTDEEKKDLIEKEGEEKKEPEFSSKYFTITRKREGEFIETQIFITNRELRNFCSSYTPYETLYDSTTSIGATELYVCLDRFKIEVKNYEQESDTTLGLNDLISFLEKEYSAKEEQIALMTKDGKMSYSYLWHLYGKDKRVYGVDDATDEKIAGEVLEFSYRSSTYSGKFAQVEVRILKTNGLKFSYTNHYFRIPYYMGTRKITQLPVKPLDEENYQLLMNRGKVYREIALGQHYLTYRGVLVWRGWTVWKVKADGRCMIDIKTFSHMNPNSNFDRFGDKEEDVQEIPDKDLWITWPTLAGFSFTAKQWGEFIITTLTPVIFDDKAYDQLVLPQKKKVLIKALVEYQSTTFTDIITGKGGGCIFLLHGSPGVGKTLTAESIAELLHRPLYSVSVGELGTTTDTLEQNLKDILQVAATWNAVVLIDEADIFLEKRTKRDVQRNALVGIFLRLLEYHQGVLFLTTNRVKTFDPAFHSRISIALKYKDLELEERCQVWHNLLHAAGIHHIKAETLAHFDLNGRQIKNCIRLAQALAKSQSTETSIAHLEETIKAAEQFKDDIKAIGEQRKLKLSSKTIIT